MSDEKTSQELSDDELKDVAGGAKITGKPIEKSVKSNYMQQGGPILPDESYQGTMSCGDIDGKSLSPEESPWHQSLPNSARKETAIS